MNKILQIGVEGLINQNINLRIVSPFKPKNESREVPEDQRNLNIHKDDDIWIVDYFQILNKTKEFIMIQFN